MEASRDPAIFTEDLARLKARILGETCEPPAHAALGTPIAARRPRKRTPATAGEKDPYAAEVPVGAGFPAPKDEWEFRAMEINPGLLLPGPKLQAFIRLGKALDKISDYLLHQNRKRIGTTQRIPSSLLRMKGTNSTLSAEQLEAGIELRKALAGVWPQLVESRTPWIEAAERFFPAFLSYAKTLFALKFSLINALPQWCVLERVNGLTKEGGSSWRPSLKQEILNQIAPDIFQFLQTRHPDPCVVESDDLARLIDLRLNAYPHVFTEGYSGVLPKRVLAAAEEAG